VTTGRPSRCLRSAGNDSPADCLERQTESRSRAVRHVGAQCSECGHTLRQHTDDLFAYCTMCDCPEFVPPDASQVR